MTLRRRLTLGLLALAAVLTVPLGLTLRSVEQLHRTTTELRDRGFSASVAVGRIWTRADELQNAETRLGVVHDSASREAVLSALTGLQMATRELNTLALGDRALQLQGSVDELSRATHAEIDAALNGRVDAADTISDQQFRPSLLRLQHAANAVNGELGVRTSRMVDRATEESDAAERNAVLFALLSGVLALAIGVWLTRSISRPIRDLQRGMEAVADGEFEHRLPIRPDRGDEFGRLAVSFREMADQLAQLDRLKAEFVSVASHELKTPINVIGGYLQLLEEGLYGPLTERQAEVLRTLEAQCESLSRLVRQLLDVSRFEAGGGKLEPRPTPLRHFLEELEHAFQVLAHQRGIHFYVARAAQLPDLVVWDPDRVNEVLGNLLSNAFKFTERGGRVELAVTADDSSVHMDVRDSGAGIPAEQLARIFEKFYQADNQSRAAAKGTGLGLAIAKQIVEAHHGTISVESTPGVGTMFTIVLPLRVPAGRRTTAPQTAVAASGASA